MNDTISRRAAIDAVSKGCEELRGVFGRCEDALKALPSAQQKALKYTGESICLYCQTINCDGCMYEPMKGCNNG